MSSLRLAHLLQHFYRHSIPCLPVMDGHEQLIGFVYRSDIDRFGADLDRLQQEHSQIPEWLVRADLAEDALSLLVEKAPVPVLDLQGREAVRWNRTDLYRRIAEFEEHRRAHPVVEAAPVAAPTERETEGDWLSRLVLGCIPHPLLATDLNGRTLFYNENFIKRILERGPFKNTLALAESYFLEVNRNALARTYSAGPHPVDLLFVSLPDLHLTLEIATLERDRSVMGYLYLFHDPEVAGLPHEITSRLEAGMDLDSIMEDMEAGIIASMLRRTGQNVSHAAKALGVNRSTLQNKIRRLDLSTRFHRKVDGPVRRIRRSRAMLEEERSGMIPPGDFDFDGATTADDSGAGRPHQDARADHGGKATAASSQAAQDRAPGEKKATGHSKKGKRERGAKPTAKKKGR